MMFNKALFNKLPSGNRSIGDITETLALTYLQQQGLKLTTKNYHCRQGELDLVMNHNGVLVFVEVRYRSNTKFGQAYETIDRKKQQKIIKATQHYLHQYKKTESISSRFDVLGIQPKDLQIKIQQATVKDMHFDWIQNAFF